MSLIGNAMAGIREQRLSIEGPLPLTAARIVDWLAGPPTASGVRINPNSALKITAYYAAIRNISEDVAGLPLFVYERLTRGKRRATEHPLYTILHDSPNPHMTAMQFRETMQGMVMPWGNAYANIERDPRSGRIMGLWPLRPDRMDAPVMSADGRLLYTYHLKNGEPRALTQDEVFHLRGLSGDGIIGYSPVALHRETLALTQATLESGARFFGNDSRPGGVLQTDKRLSPEAADRLRAQWAALHQGINNSHRVAVLEEGVTWQQVGIPPEDAQWLQTRQFQVQDIARMTRIQPHKIADLSRGTFSNIEEQSLEYVTDTLRSWLIRWEQQINMSLLLPAERGRFFAEHLLDALLRGKMFERAQALDIWRRNGVINADDWREIENLNGLPDEKGQSYWMPANMMVAGQTPGAPGAPGAVTPAPPPGDTPSETGAGA